MAFMRAKLTVDRVTHHDSNNRDVVFVAKYDHHNTPEDNSYSKYTPSASMNMTVTNPDLSDKIKPGMQFYVDFTLIPSAKKEGEKL